MKPLALQAQTLVRRLQVHERIFSLMVAFVIGLVTGVAALFFRWLIEGLTTTFRRVPEYAESLLAWETVGIIAMPALGGAIVGPMIWRWAPEAQGHGVPEVMAAVLRKGGFIRPRVAFVKALASAICIGSGGSVGREGPIIQIGSSVGSTIGFLLHQPPRLMRTFVACGAAGGIAATFNAPIAGALFAVEIILGDFGFIQLAPIVTTSVIATVVSRGLEGDFAAFRVPSYTLEHPLELVPYVVLGLVCGLAAVGFIRTLDFMERLFDRRVKVHNAAKPVVGGLAVGTIGVFFPQVFGVGYATVDGALYAELPLLLLAGLAVSKLAATTLTLASGGSGGIFAPSLFMGAMLGGLVGRISNWALPVATASSGAYALVGMAAMVGAATHAPITAIVIIFELTNDYKIILPLMISTIIGVLTAAAVERESIYTHKLKRQGIDVDEGLEANVLKRVQVGDVLRKEFETVPQALPFNFAVDQLLESARSHLPVLTESGRLVGTVNRETARRFLRDKNVLADTVIAHDLAEDHGDHLLPGDTLDRALLRFNETGKRELYVLDDMVRRNAVGMVRKGDLMDVYQREMAKRATGDTFAYTINRAQRVESVKVMDGYGIIELEAPHDFSGQQIRELDLRNRYGINVLAIKRQFADGESSNTLVWVPESTDRLADGDVLVVLGRSEHLSALQEGW